ncbi:MAG: hypothetical protein EPN47_09045 [Acidobacteria bacterium]|nr:MAG: hypothetical protein EPN47_09045 [Acidobacteriota bacterium]
MTGRNIPFRKIGLLSVMGFALAGSGLFGAGGSILQGLSTITSIASTVPAIGDVNPYGVAQVKATTGNLVAGDILVSNFNNAANLQGTGTTIVQVAADGSVSLFAEIHANTLPGPCPGGVGLTTALVVLQSGWVIVGSLPTTDGMSDTIGAGCLIVLNSKGSPVETFSGNMINGPWDMTVDESGQNPALFVTNVLNGTVAAGGGIVNEGTVLRIDLTVSQNTMPAVKATTIVGSGFPERTDPAALVIGPTGVGLSPACPDGGDNCASPVPADARVLYVADSLENRIAVIPQALTRTTSGNIGTTLSEGNGLNDPLGLTVVPNGNILTVNGNNGFITEFTPDGRRIAIRLLDHTSAPSPGNGTLFGLVFDPDLGVVFVDDGSNTLNLLH